MRQDFVDDDPAVRSRALAALSGWPRATEDIAVPDVSVCIANWNCRDYLRGCLESLLDDPQGVSVEVIVADNASTASPLRRMSSRTTSLSR